MPTFVCPWPSCSYMNRRSHHVLRHANRLHLISSARAIICCDVSFNAVEAFHQHCVDFHREQKPTFQLVSSVHDASDYAEPVFQQDLASSSPYSHASTDDSSSARTEDSAALRRKRLLTDFYVALKANLTHESYKLMLDSDFGGIQRSSLPRSLPRLKREGERAIGVDWFAFVEHGNGAKAMPLKTLIRFWLASAPHSKAIKAVNEVTHSTLHGAFTPEGGRYGPMWACSSWTSQLGHFEQAARSLGRPAVYLHGLLFVDDYVVYKNYGYTNTLVALTLAEFDPGMRSSREDGFNLPYTVIERKIGAPGNATLIDVAIAELAREMTQISEEGLVVYSEAHRAEVAVFFVLHGFLGDSVARQEVVGSSRSTIHMRQCFLCGVSAEDRQQQFANESIIFRREIRNEQDVRAEAASQAFDSTNTFTRLSAIWQVPLFSPVNQQCIDLMHLEGLGLIKLHFELLRFTDEEARSIGRVMQDLASTLSLGTFPRVDKAARIKTLKAHPRMLLALFSPIVFGLSLSPVRLQDPLVKAWWFHADYFAAAIQYSISDEELERMDSSIRQCWQPLVGVGAVRDDIPNVHLLTHLVDVIRTHGAPRGYWCFSPESMIGGLRYHGLRNTNGKRIHRQLHDKVWRICNVRRALGLQEDHTPIYRSTPYGVRAVHEALPLQCLVKATIDGELRFGAVQRRVRDSFMCKLVVITGYQFGLEEFRTFEMSDVQQLFHLATVEKYYYALCYRGTWYSVPYLL